ncbi:MAG: hypothetical protein OIF50_13380 [Flavobacteriaceae bacterium]|nr:hypothetical protein [Flavobacteriaceae bacterium]
MFLGTNHYSEAVLGNSIGFNNLNLLLYYHPHPGTSKGNDDKASGYSFKDIKKGATKGFHLKNSGNDIAMANKIYNTFIKAGKISVENNYKGAPRFFIYRPHFNPPYYFEYDPWHTKK